MAHSPDTWEAAAAAARALDQKLRPMAKQAAHRFSHHQRENGYVPTGLFCYTDGEATGWKVRLDHPQRIQPNFDGDGKTCFWMQYNPIMNVVVLGKPEFKGGTPLFNWPDLITRPDETVYVVEGEKCVLGLKKLGFLAVTWGGSGDDEDADWTVLQGRGVIIWPDNDDSGRRCATRIAEKLKAQDCVVNMVDISVLKLPVGGDFMDWLIYRSDAEHTR